MLTEDGSKNDEKQGCRDENRVRGNWSSQVDFVLSIVGYSVGLSNLWRFPYLCMRNGGGAFLMPYFLFLLLCGLPLTYLELVIGQFSSCSPLTVWKICPLLSGIGWGMLIVSSIATIYYSGVIAWILYYLGKSFTSELPWATCGHWWNTPLCNERGPLNGTNISTIINGTEHFTYVPGKLDKLAELRETMNITGNETIKLFTPAEEFWHNEVLQMSGSIEEVGGVRWQLLVCLIVAWILILLCLFKGVKSSGKVVYVTVTAPYVILTILLARGLLLPGSVDGILFYLTPDFSLLLSFKVWAEACLQVFYSLGPAWGGLIALSSYNRFNNNCLRDAVIVCLSCGGTSFFAGFVIFSVIGFMAKEAGVSVEDVITQGPGLAFIAYPEAITKLPISPVWSILFFLMLLTLGLDSQFVLVESVVCSIVDRFPKHLERRKTLLTALVSLTLCVVGTIFITRAGMYYFHIVDWYCVAFSLMIFALLECVSISWIYGMDRLYYDIEMMLERRPSIFWKLCWCFCTPAIMARVRKLLRCTDDWGPALPKHYSSYRYAKHNLTARAMQPLVSKGVSHLNG